MLHLRYYLEGNAMSENYTNTETIPCTLYDIDGTATCTIVEDAEGNTVSATVSIALGPFPVDANAKFRESVARYGEVLANIIDAALGEAE